MSDFPLRLEELRNGTFAFIGILLILIDFVPLAVGLSLSQGNFQSKFIKIAFPMWLVMLVVGIVTHNSISAQWALN